MKTLTLVLLLQFFHFQINAQNFDNEISDVAQSIVNQLSAKDINTISIIDFSKPNGDVSALGRSISNKLRINIAKNSPGISIVNRSVLSGALKEEQLFKNGLINPESAKKINFIGVDVLILGEISDYGNNYSVEIQLIDTEKSDLVGGEMLEIPKTESLKSLNENILESREQTGASSYSGNQKSKSSPTNSNVIERELGEIIVRVERLSYSGSNLIISYKLYNNADIPILIGLSSGRRNEGLQTKINQEGDIYFSSSVKIGHRNCNQSCYVKETISAKSWVKGTITFKDIPPLDEVNLLHVNFFYRKEGVLSYQDLVVRNIQIE